MKNIFLNHKKTYLSYTITMMEIDLHGLELWEALEDSNKF